MNRLAKIGTGFTTLVEKTAVVKPAAPAFIGRRRRGSESSSTNTPAFVPKWKFDTDPEHMFRIATLSENKQPFTPPPTTTAVWGEEAPESPPIEAAWNDDVSEPDMDLDSPPHSPGTPPNFSPTVNETPTEETFSQASSEAPNDVAAWSVSLQSPQPITTLNTNDAHTLVPWVARPLSPVQEL